MNAFFINISRKFIWTFAVILVLGIIFYGVSRAITPSFFKRYHNLISQRASELLQQPVDIASINATWHGLEPVVQMHDAIVYDTTHTNPLIHVREIDLGINLFSSLLHRQIELRTVTISGVALIVQETQDKKWIINSINNFTTTSTQNLNAIHELLAWLSSLHRISLHDVSIDWYVPDGRKWSFHQLNVKLESFEQHYYIEGNAWIMQASPAQVIFGFDATGDLNKLTTMRYHLAVQTNGLQAWPILQLLIATSPATFATINSLQPVGKLQDIIFDYDGSKPQTLLWQLNAKVQNAGWNHYEDLPGAQGLSGELQLKPESGSLALDSENSILDFGSLFRHSIALDNLDANVIWYEKNQQWFVQLDNLMAKNADIALVGKGTIIIPSNNPEAGNIDINASYHLNGSTFSKVGSYLPLTVIPKSVINWLERSIKSGEGGDGTLVLRGPWHHFPFYDKSGLFLIECKIKNATLDYWPKWPTVQKISGELIFLNQSMMANLNSAQILNVPINNVIAKIPDLGSDPQISIQSKVNANIADGLNFIRNSPLQKTVGSHINALQLNGPMQLNLQLNIPLSETSKQSTTVLGNVTLQNDILQLPTWGLQIPQLQGQLQFTQDGITANNISGNLLGSPINIAIANDNTGKANAVTTITAQGALKVSQLKNKIPAKFYAKLAGQTNYTIAVSLPKAANKSNHLSITSPLNGLAINLPGSLGKTASQNTMFTLNTDFGVGQVMNLIINYGNNIFAKLFYNTTNAQLQQINAHVVQLNAFNQALGTADIQGARTASGWLININSANAIGQIILSNNYLTQGIQANFTTIKLNNVNTSDTSTSSLKPSDVPPISLVSNVMTYGKINLGRVYLQLQPQKDGSLAITRLQTIAPSFNLLAAGLWQSVPGPQGNITYLHGSLHSNNIANTLASWGFSGDLSGNKGDANFVLDWADAPFHFKLALLEGSLAFKLSNGAITEIGTTSSAKMDIGRLFSVLSLQTIARRLRLDFSDLTAKGFSFDTFQSQLNFARGMATVKNSFIDGPIAHIDINGNIDLSNETYNLNLNVTPHMTSSLSLPILATIAGGPIAGVIALAANRIISPEVQKMASSHYWVYGPWGAPVVKSFSDSTNKTPKG